MREADPEPHPASQFTLVQSDCKTVCKFVTFTKCTNRGVNLYLVNVKMKSEASLYIVNSTA